MLNLSILDGRPTKKLELRTSENGNTYTKFTLAVNFYLSKQERTTFVPITVFGKRAENLVANLKDKGRVLIEGSIINEHYQSESGETVYAWSVLAGKIRIYDFKDKNINNEEEELNTYSEDDIQDFVIDDTNFYQG